MKHIDKLLKWIIKNKYLILLIGIFLFELFLRFYQMEQKSPFGYDQVDNAWAAKNIIVDQKIPLVGMVAKGNSGIYIGPFYYYLISIIYYFTDLNPIASAIFSSLTSIFTFWVIYFISKKLFSKEVALLAVFINTFVMAGIFFDRVQWPVNFIPSVSLIIFYLLYKIILGDVKKILILSLTVGISFSIHFTSIFYPIIIILTLPFFPKNKKTLKYIFLSLPLFFIWLVPNVVYFLQQKAYVSNASYIQENFHGFHLRRFIQIAGDGLIQFNPYLITDKIATIKFVILPIFFIKYLYRSLTRDKLFFCYLILLWFVVPWVVFATYKGEISDYYFSINRFIALIIISYLIISLFRIKNIILSSVVIIILIYIAAINVINYLPYNDRGYKQKEEYVKSMINQQKKVEYVQGAPESYLYYYFMRQKNNAN